MATQQLPLSDATLIRMHLDWSSDSCVLELQSAGAETLELVFLGVKDIEIPAPQPLCMSMAMNAPCEAADRLYEVQIESGHVIRVLASGWYWM